MSIRTVKERLAAIAETVVSRAYADAPRSISPSDLPAVIVFTGDGEYDYRRMGSQMDSVTRLYTIRLLARSVQTGASGEVLSQADSLLDSLVNVFAARPQLSLRGLVTPYNPATDGPLSGVLDSWVTRDTGVGVVDQGGVSYISCDITLAVQEVRNVTYA